MFISIPLEIGIGYLKYRLAVLLVAEVSYQSIKDS